MAPVRYTGSLTKYVSTKDGGKGTVGELEVWPALSPEINV